MRLKTLSLCLLSLYAGSAFGITPQAYVTDQAGTAVQIIDIDQNTIQSIFGFTNPVVVKITPDGTQAWVGESNGTVRIIDTITHSILPTALMVPATPVALSISPDNEFVYVGTQNAVTVIRISDQTIVDTITGFTNLHDVKVLPSNAFVYVTDGGTGSISVISMSNNTIINTITGFQNPKGITFTNDGQYAYVTDSIHNLLYQVHTLDHTLLGTVLGFNVPEYIAMTPDSNFAYVSNSGNDTISMLRLSDNQIIQEISVPQPKSIAVTMDGAYLFTGSMQGAVFKLETLTSSIVNALPGFGNPSNIAITDNNPPAITLNGCQFANSAGILGTRLTWQPSPGSPTGYRIFRDSALTNLVAALSGSTTSFADSPQIDGQTYSYYLIADYANGFSSTFGNIEVNPTRTCLGDM